MGPPEWEPIETAPINRELVKVYGHPVNPQGLPQWGWQVKGPPKEFLARCDKISAPQAGRYGYWVVENSDGREFVKPALWMRGLQLP